MQAVFQRRVLAAQRPAAATGACFRPLAVRGELRRGCSAVLMQGTPQNLAPFRAKPSTQQSVQVPVLIYSNPLALITGVAGPLRRSMFLGHSLSNPALLTPVRFTATPDAAAAAPAAAPEDPHWKIAMAELGKHCKTHE